MVFKISKKNYCTKCTGYPACHYPHAVSMQVCCTCCHYYTHNGRERGNRQAGAYHVGRMRRLHCLLCQQCLNNYNISCYSCSKLQQSMLYLVTIMLEFCLTANFLLSLLICIRNLWESHTKLSFTAPSHTIASTEKYIYNGANVAQLRFTNVISFVLT